MPASDVGFALAVFGFVAWVAALTLFLPRALARGVAFLANRYLARKAHLSISALYLYPLAGRFVAHRIVFADADAAISVAELVVVWRWWRRGRLTAFDDGTSAVSSLADESTCASWFSCWRPIVDALRACVNSASPLRDEGPAPLLSFTCSGLRVRLISMKANYDLLERLRAFASGDLDDDFVQPLPTPLDDSQPGKTMIDHMLEYSSLKVHSGALYVCDPGSSSLARVLFSTAKIRYRHGRPRSSLDLFRFTLSFRITELHISVAEKEILRGLSMHDPPDAGVSEQDSLEPEDQSCWSWCVNCARAAACMSRSERSRNGNQSRDNCACFGRGFSRFSRAKHDLQCIDIVHASEAIIEYICDQPGPDIPLLDISNGDSEDAPLPPELRTSVELHGASISYQAKAISCLQDVQERLFPRLFDLTRVAEDFQGRMRRRVPHSFVLEIVALAKIDPEHADDAGGGPANKIPLVSTPYMPRENTWRLLKMLGVKRGPGDDGLPESSIAIYSEKVSVHTEIPYKLGDPLNVRADLPDVQLVLEGIVDAPVCTADAVNVLYQIKFPKVWNHVHKSRCDCTVYSGEFTYMPDLIRCIDDLAAAIDQQSRKPEDVRYFVPNAFSVSINAVEGFSVRLAASRGNAWADVYKGLSDDFGMAVLKGETATFSLDLNAGLEYQPSVIPVQWRLHIPKPSLFLALPCPQPSDDPFIDPDYDDEGEQHVVLNASGHENLTFAQRVRLLIEGTNAENAESTAQKSGIGVRSKNRQSRPRVTRRDHEQVLIRIIEVGGECVIQGRVTTHDKLYADGINRNRVMIRLSGLAFDLNPHHLQHLLNVISNCSSLTNHTLTAEEKHRIDIRRKSLAHKVVADARVPTFEECIILGTEGGISLATSAYHAGDKAPPATAMDDAASIDLEIDGGCLMLHNLPNALCSFAAHPSQVCSIDVGHASFALTGNHKEVVARFSPLSEAAPIRIYPGQPRELKSNIFRRAQNRPTKTNLLAKYPQIALSEFMLTRQVLFNKQLGAYYANLEVGVAKIEGCIQETTLMSIIGFVKSVSIRPAYDEAPVVEALVGVQTVQVRIGRTDILILCGSRTTASREDNTAGHQKSSDGVRPATTARGSTRKRQRSFVGTVPVSVAGVAQFRLRDGLRLCMSNFATSDYLSRTGVTVPDLSVQLFTPWGGGRTTPWIDEPTLRAQVSHSSAIKAWRQVGVQQGRAVMHRAGVFEHFVMRLIWESHPSLWSDTVYMLQRSRLALADRYSRRIAHLWEAPEPTRNSGVAEDPPTVLESYNLKWWEFLDCVARRERSAQQSPPTENNLRRDVVSVFILSNMSLSIGPEALELAYYMATNIRSAHEERRRSARENASDLIEVWRDLNTHSAQSEDHDRLRGEHRTPRVHGTTVNLNLFVSSASVYLICPFLAEDVMDRTRVGPVIIRDERVCASFPQGLQLSYRWRSQRGATGVPSPVEDVSAGPTSPSYSLSLRQSAFVVVPLILVQSSVQQMASVSNFRGRLADSVTFKRKRRIGGDLAEETHRGSHRTFDVSVSSCSLGKPGSDLASYSELGRVLSIYGLMLRALSLDLNATFRWHHERRDAVCDAVFAVPFSVLEKLSPAQIQVVCFGRQVLFLKSDRYIPQGTTDGTGKNSFRASEDLETNMVSIARSTKSRSASHPYTGANDCAACSVAVRAGIDEFSVALCDREAFVISKFAGEGQFETAQGSRFPLQEPPLGKFSVGSVTISLRDDVADSGLRAVSAVASYIRFAALYIPMLSYEVDVQTQENVQRRSLPTRSRGDSEEWRTVTPQTPAATGAVNDDSVDVPKRSRYSVRNPNRFKLRRNVPSQESPQDVLRHVRSSPSWTPRVPRTRRGPTDELSVGQGQSSVGSADYRNPDDESREETSHRQSTSKRRSGRSNFYSSSITWRGEKRGQRRSNDASEQPSQVQHVDGQLQNLYEQSVELGPGLKNVFQIYQAPRGAESSSPRLNRERRSSTKKPENDSKVEETGAVDGRKHSSKPLRKRDSRSRKHVAAKATDQASPRKQQSNLSKLRMSTAQAATIVCSVDDVQISYFRSESRDLYGLEFDQCGLQADLAIAVKKIRASGVITPFALCQSVVITVDDASLMSGNNTRCVLESSVKSIVSILSISSGILPSSPKRIVSSSKVSDFKVSLRAQDLRSVLAFSEKFKKDMTSLASSAVSTRASLAAMARATKLENLTKTSGSRVSFATVAVDIAFDKVCVSLLGFHPADKDMKISYEVDSISGSLVEMQDSSIALSLGGLVYGHGLVLSSPSWPGRERFDFPALDARGVQWMHTTGLPTQVKVIAGHLISSTSFQGVRHVLFAVSGLLAFQNRFVDEAERSRDSLPTPPRNNETRSVRRSLDSSASAEQSAALSRSWIAWERTKAVRMEYALRPMSIGLVSGGVMARFDTENISGVIEWNKLVTSGTQLQAVLQLPQFSITYSKVDDSNTSQGLDDARAEQSSLLVAIQDMRLDLLKSQTDIRHDFIFRVHVGSVNGQLRPWRLMSDAAVWANEQDLVQEFQAVNSDATAKSRSFPSTYSDLHKAANDPQEHRVIVVGVDVSSVRVAVPLLDVEDLENHRLRVIATDVRYQMRLGDEIALPSQSNLAQLRSAFVGVLWEDSAFLSAQRAEVMFAARAPTTGKKAHFGAIRGSCSTKTWIVCPRKDVVLAFIDAKDAPENIASNTVTSPMPRATSSQLRIEIPPNIDAVKDRRQLFQSVEFMVLPSQGYIRGLDPMDVFSGQSTSYVDPDDVSHASRGVGELSIPTFSVAWLRRPAFDFDLIDVDFSMKSDEFPQGILRKTGNIFSELFGAIATSTEDTSAVVEPEFARTPSAPRQVTRDWSALIRFGESRYVARENVTGKLNARLEFYAGKHAGFLASVAANPDLVVDGAENATVVTGVAPELSMAIKPALLNADTQCLKLGYVRILQGYAPSLTPHTIAHVTEVNAEMDVMTALLVREWLKREQRFGVRKQEASVSPDKIQDLARAGTPWNSNTVIVLGRPAGSKGDSFKKLSPRKVEPAVRIILRLSQPDGRVGLLIQRIHIGAAMQKVRSSTSGYWTDIHIGLHEIGSKAEWESLYCSFKLKRLLFRLEGERGMCEKNICGFAGIVNHCEFAFKRADIDALSLKIDGIAGACRVPDCDLAVQTTVIDTSISSLTGKMIERLLHLAARLAREARRQVESLALSEASVHDSQVNFSIDSGGSIGGFDAPQSRMRGTGSRRGGVHVVRESRIGRGTAGGAPSRSREVERCREFSRATAFLSGDTLSVKMHGYQFEETNGSAQLKFLQYEVDYKQQSGYSSVSKEGEGVDTSGSTRSLTLVRQLKVEFGFLDLCYSNDARSTPYSMLRVPMAMLNLSVHEKESTATVDFETKFEKEIEIGTAISHFDRLRGLLKLYAESRSQVAKELDKSGDLRMLQLRGIEEAEGQSSPFGGRIPDFRNLKLKPQLKILGELTPDLTILERFGLGKKEVIEQAIPAGLYDYVMVPVGNVVEALTKPLL